jgi:hypothetical protein
MMREMAEESVYTASNIAKHQHSLAQTIAMLEGSLELINQMKPAEPNEEMISKLNMLAALIKDCQLSNMSNIVHQLAKREAAVRKSRETNWSKIHLLWGAKFASINSFWYVTRWDIARNLYTLGYSNADSADLVVRIIQKFSAQEMVRFKRQCMLIDYSEDLFLQSLQRQIHQLIGSAPVITVHENYWAISGNFIAKNGLTAKCKNCKTCDSANPQL